MTKEEYIKSPEFVNGVSACFSGICADYAAYELSAKNYHNAFNYAGGGGEGRVCWSLDSPLAEEGLAKEFFELLKDKIWIKYDAPGDRWAERKLTFPEWEDVYAAACKLVLESNG